MHAMPLDLAPSVCNAPALAPTCCRTRSCSIARSSAFMRLQGITASQG